MPGILNLTLEGLPLPGGFLPKPFCCEPNPATWTEQDGEYILRGILQAELTAALPPGFAPLSGADIELTVFWPMRSFRSRPRPPWLESLWLANPDVQMPIHSGSPMFKERNLFERVFLSALPGYVIAEGSKAQLTATHLFRPHSGLELRITVD